ncbi:MAG: hypothetical protein ACRDPX_05980 [Gaiellaceae bacterium]
MRRVVLGVVLGALLHVSSTSASAAPQLRIVSAEPTVVVGVGFHPHEKVRLLITPGPATRMVRAGQRGRFRAAVRFSIPRCGSFVVQALGNQGSRAMIDRVGLDCASID